MKGPRLTLAVIAGGTFMVTFDGGAVQMALPALGHDLHAPIADVQWTMTGYLLASTAGLLPAGRAGDSHGRARIWRLGVIVFTLASAMATLVPGLWWLVGARVLQGIGAALVTSVAAALLADVFPDDRGLALGIGNVAIALGLVTGPPLGALLTRAVSWRLLFPPAILVGTLALLGARHRLPRTERSQQRQDIAGTVSSVLGLTALLVGATHGRRWGYEHPVTLIILAAGALLVAAFIVCELRTREPLLQMSLFRSRWFLSGALTALFGFAGLFSVTLAMPYFLVGAQGRSLESAGLIAAIVPLGLSIGAPLAGWATDKVGSRGICATGLALVAGSLVALALGGQDARLALVLVALGTTGFGMGCFEAPNVSTSLGSLPQDRLGIGTATLGVMRNLGMTIGTAAAATLLAWRIDRGHGNMAMRTAEGVRVALVGGAASAILGSISALLRPSGRPEKDEARDTAPEPAHAS